jgi:ABC-2 type transport system ATP-binding protein
MRTNHLGRTFSLSGGAKRATIDAVSDVSFDVERGELVAFLGPNGAGKTTTLRMLATLLPPTSGSATVAGFDITANPAEVRHRIGYIGQGTSAGHNQRVRDEMLSQGAFYGMPSRAVRSRTDELLESLQLTEIADRTVGKLSGGQKRRLDIALGLIHSPELLFLDEPSTGLDPQSRANLWQHIIDLREQHGTTIFVTTHYLDEADTFAERVMVMDNGRVIADDTASALKSTLAGDVITLGFTTAADAAAAEPDAVRLSSASSSTRTGAELELVVTDGELVLPSLVRNVDVTRAGLRQPTLDDVFLALTGRSLRDSARAPRETPTTDTPITENVPS